MMLLHQSICHGHSGTRGRSPFKREVIFQARLLFTCQICFIFRQETRCHKCQREPTGKCDFCDRWAWFVTIPLAPRFLTRNYLQLFSDWFVGCTAGFAGWLDVTKGWDHQSCFLWMNWSKLYSFPLNRILISTSSRRRFSALIVKQSELYLSPLFRV